MVIGLPVIAAAQSTNWVYTGSLNTAREDHTATLLLNGKVLVTGGQGNYGSLASAELYAGGVSMPFQITSIVQTNASDLLIAWNTTGTSNIVQVSPGAVADGSFSTNSFMDLTNIVVTTATTNFWDVGALTNGAARYYRIRSPQ